MQDSFKETVDNIRGAFGKVVLSPEDILIVTADEISRTTTYNEQHARNAAPQR
ncbi:MAG: hypothetical protein PHC61_08635 [Chitinivibrionales bacterium]|nr:hypothetical protein [Chitinivibrionales bacterium]